MAASSVEIFQTQTLRGKRADFPSPVNLEGTIGIATDEDNKSYISIGGVWEEFTATPDGSSNGGQLVTEAVAASRNIATTDDGKLLAPADTVVFTIPQDLSPQPTVLFSPPASGSFSVIGAGSVKINGAALTSFPRGISNGLVSLVPIGTNDYLLSGM